jgi:hypothetical protein
MTSFHSNRLSLCVCVRLQLQILTKGQIFMKDHAAWGLHKFLFPTISDTNVGSIVQRSVWGGVAAEAVNSHCTLYSKT